MAALSRRQRLRPAARWLQKRPPLFVSWMLTEACNYTCDHCGCWRDPPEELSAEEARAYAQQMVEAGVVAVSLCGGEVTLRKDLGQLLAILHEGGVTTRITSNGRLVPRRIDDLRPLSRLKLSLDGPPDLHEQIRGRGSYGAVLEALDAARGAGIPTQLNIVLHDKLLPRLDETLELVGQLSCTATFNPLEVRHGSAADGVEAAAPDPAAHRAAVQRLIALKRAGDRRVANSPGTLQVMLGWPHLEPVDCAAGRWFCRVTADGRVVACDRDYAPHPPGRERPDSFTAGLATLQRAGVCAQGCWRNNTIEVNRGLRGALDALTVMGRWR